MISCVVRHKYNQSLEKRSVWIGSFIEGDTLPYVEGFKVFKEQHNIKEKNSI